MTSKIREDLKKMIKEKRIGLVFTGNENWIGGLYYIVNIVKAISFLPDNDKISVILLYNNKTPKELLNETKFPFVKQVNLYNISFFRKTLYSLLFRVFKRNYLFNYHVRKNNIEVLYPFNEYHKDLEFISCQVIYWIFDFQHKFMPELFSKTEISRRNVEFGRIARNAETIVVSSNTAKTHFQKFYPQSKANVKVLQFASIVDHEKLPAKNELIEKYDIPKSYFLVSNQFWQHKNHMVVLKALKEVVKNSKEIFIVFTGKEHDPRNPEYVNHLKEYISANKLNKYVTFLGFIPRYDQLGLMKNSIAVIQPSQFEGWGTVVEDAKALAKNVILSDIEIHREQMEDAVFFKSDDTTKLAEILIDCLKTQGSTKENQISNHYYLSFANCILEIFNNVHLENIRRPKIQIKR